MPAILDDEDSGYTSEGRSCGGSNSGIDIANASELPTVIKPTPPARVDWLRTGQVMRRPKLIFDGRNVVEPEALAKLGFKVECIGKPKRRLLVV